MRVTEWLFMGCIAFGLVACGGGQGVDTTPNQMAPTASGDYPPGPYGYNRDSVIENIPFIGKRDPGGYMGTASYDALPMEQFSLADFHKDASAKYLFLSGSAGWCGPCNAEQPSVKAAQAKFEPKGVRFLEVLLEGYKRGSPATESDLNHWADNHKLHLPLAIDPEAKLFKFGDIAAFPLNIVIDLRTMTMELVELGEQDVEALLGRFVK